MSNHTVYNKTNLSLFIALGNLFFFSAVFALMNYVELLGTDTSYFDEGSLNNLAIINRLLSILGLAIDPSRIGPISTLHYAVLLGIALLSTGFSILLANRREDEFYEVTQMEVKS